MVELILIGDVIVMGFMTGAVVWLLTAKGKRRAEEDARIPLEDENG